MSENAPADAAGQPAPTLDQIKSTTTPPDSQLAKEEALKAEVETRRVRLASNLLEQKHELINILSSVLGFVILGMYCTFILTVAYLFLSHKAFETNFPVTAVVLIGLTGSIPTILSLSLMVGLFAKDSSKEEKAGGLFDAATVIKVGTELIKSAKSPH